MGQGGPGAVFGPAYEEDRVQGLIEGPEHEKKAAELLHVPS